MRQETKESATEKIQALRAQVAKDKKDKMRDGQTRAKAGTEEIGGGTEVEKDDAKRAGGVTWNAPEEMRCVDYTAQEKEFAEIVEGPNAKVFKHQPVEGKPHPGRHGETAPQAAQEMIRKAQSLAEGPVLGALQGASDDLYAWAAARVANDPNIGLAELLEDMVQFGLGELAAEAAQILEETGEVKAGSSRRCVVHETAWEGEGPGRAQVELDGQVWAMYDYREEIMMTEELAGLVGVVNPEVEKRQCVTKVLAAGSLMGEDPQQRLPSMEAVEQRAQEYRLE